MTPFPAFPDLTPFPSPAGLLDGHGFMLLLQSIVLVLEPSLLIGPFGGIIKNIGLIALAWIFSEAGRNEDIRWTGCYHDLAREASSALQERRCLIRSLGNRIKIHLQHGQA